MIHTGSPPWCQNGDPSATASSSGRGRSGKGPNLASRVGAVGPACYYGQESHVLQELDERVHCHHGVYCLYLLYPSYTHMLPTSVDRVLRITYLNNSNQLRPWQLIDFHQIDPSWGRPIELFLVPASAPRLV